jgi:hypothetical protein
MAKERSRFPWPDSQCRASRGRPGFPTWLSTTWSSALRVYIAGYFAGSAPRYGFADPKSRLAFRLERPSKSRKRLQKA